MLTPHSGYAALRSSSAGLHEYQLRRNACAAVRDPTQPHVVLMQPRIGYAAAQTALRNRAWILRSRA